MHGPYYGLRVVDLADAMPGSYAARILAELGAEVVKIEPPQGNSLRGQPAHQVFNRSKKSVVADPSSRSGRELSLNLLQSADIAVVDYLHSEAKNVGFEYHTVAGRNPRLIYCSVPPMNSDTPLAETPRCEDLVMAHSGLMGAQWAKREGPVYHILPMASYGAAFLATAAIGAALHVRESTGRGQRVEVSWLAGAVAMSMFHIVMPEQEQPSPWDRDPQGGMSPAYRLYECGDGQWLVISCGHATFFNKLCLALDMPEVLADPRFENGPWGIDRAHRPFLIESFATAFKSRTRDEWIRHLMEWDVPCAPVVSREEAIDDPQLLHSGIRVEIEDPELGPTTQFALPLSLSATPLAIKGPAPGLGEHTAALGSTPWPRLSSRLASSEAVTRSAPSLPLQGVRVVDLGTVIFGAMVGKVLSDLGAEVVKVEPVSGEPGRGVAYSFASMNRGKRSLAVDIASPEGREIFEALVRDADIVTENFRPGVARLLGIEYETLRALNPRIIYLSSTAWGTSGPYATLPGYDPLVSARTGLMRAQGGRGNPPVYNNIGCFDHGGAMTSVYGLLAALYHRDKTGEGQHLENSIFGMAPSVQAISFIRYEGKPAEPDGGPDLLGIAALHRLYHASEGWLMVVASTTEAASRLLQTLGGSELAGRYPAEVALAAPRDGALAQELEAIFPTRTRDAWLEDLRKAGVPVAAALDVRDIYSDPQYAASRLFLLEEQPPWGNIWLATGLAKFSDCPGAVCRRSPSKGEHNDEILRELDYGAERIVDLRQRRVISFP